MRREAEIESGRQRRGDGDERTTERGRGRMKDDRNMTEQGMNESEEK